MEVAFQPAACEGATNGLVFMVEYNPHFRILHLEGTYDDLLFFSSFQPPPHPHLTHPISPSSPQLPHPLWTGYSSLLAPLSLAKLMTGL